MQIRSKEIEKTKTFLYTGAFEIERNGSVKTIKDNFITDENTAQLRAIAEFLENGYDKQIVEFETYFVDVKVNDIIKVYAPSYRVPAELNKDRFIVKKVTHYFKDGFIRTKIKAIRYD